MKWTDQQISLASVPCSCSTSYYHTDLASNSYGLGPTQQKYAQSIQDTEKLETNTGSWKHIRHNIPIYVMNIWNTTDMRKECKCDFLTHTCKPLIVTQAAPTEIKGKSGRDMHGTSKPPLV